MWRSGVLFLFAFFLLTSPALADHGIALRSELKYGPAFTHFDYADPLAPKGGEMRLAALGSFDTLNPFTLKGVAAAGVGSLFDTLMESSLDEPFSEYGRLAESVTVAPDRSWVSYKLRPQARFSDGSPVTPEDVVFSFETLCAKGHPMYRSYYKDVLRAEKTGPQEVKFTFKGTDNAELPMIMGQMPVLSKRFWQDKDFAATTLEPVTGSGPYVIEKVEPGRSITLKHVANWWGENLPVNKGLYNFERLHYDYYRDASVALEALLAGKVDFRLENVAKNWATAYDSPSVKKGWIVRREVPIELPAGMQGFAINTRRPLFQDPRVRQALALAFDFEWGNKNVAFGAYKRTNSYFANSELASSGLPSVDELKLLEPLRDQIPPEVFTQTYQAPKTDGSGDIRANLRKATELLAEAGWTVRDGKLKNAKGDIFRFEIIDSSPLFERWVLPFVRNLERLGIEARYRVVDSAQYQNLLDDFNFDMTGHVFAQSLNPGNEQRDYWGAAKADQKGSRNLIGVRSKAVDALIEAMIHAKDRAALVTACHALDRVLLWSHYVIPHWNAGVYRIAYWNKFGMPKIDPKYGFDMTALWWLDAAKDAKLEAERKRQ